MNAEEDFLSKQAQTNPYPFLIDIERAEGVYVYDKNGKSYFDMTAGVAVNNIGHRHKNVINAIRNQIDKHLHVMVYGEYIQDAQINFSNELTSILPKELNCVYPVNSGTEANEAAIKLAKRATGRNNIISLTGSYHGSTIGSLSISGNEIKKQAFRPLMPGVDFIKLNDLDELQKINKSTAAVIIETIQGDAGVRIPKKDYLKALKNQCKKVGALLIFDEIQCGMGRTGRFFAFEHFNILPDILTLGKALGGGMPIGAMVSSKELLNEFTYNPALGHITTFGGHPVICAASAACIQTIKSEIDWDEIEEKGSYLQNSIGSSKEITESRRIGFMCAFDMLSAQRVQKVVDKCLEKGVLLFWFLSHPNSFRISPPLNITMDELKKATELINQALVETS